MLSKGKNCNSLITGGHLIIVALTAISVTGTGVGVYTTLNANIAINTKAISDIEASLNKIMEHMDKVDTERVAYEAEVRNRLLFSDKEMREGLRLLAQKIIDISNERNENKK